MSAEPEYSLEQQLADLSAVKRMAERYAQQIELIRLSGEDLELLEDMENDAAFLRLLHFAASARTQQSITSVINISSAPKLNVSAIAESLRQARSGEDDG
ncbi:hypothetical protein [Rhizobium sp. FKY42]|uniref:hypothetical protein n=1 Tax=Rhizobium sp. FKY42 TaxID=2562310 RepID=UPI0010C13606|nr:hypothetical protein [Rhizobium sp. FKY42]